MTATAFLTRITEAANELGIAPSTLTERAVQNSRIPERLENGGSITLKTAERIETWIADALAEKRARDDDAPGSASPDSALHAPAAE